MYFVKRRWFLPLSALGEAAKDVGVLPDTRVLLLLCTMKCLNVSSINTPSALR